MIERARLQRLMEGLRETGAPVRVLHHLAWPASVRERFFAAGARELPRVEYPPFDAGPTCDRIAGLRRELGTADCAVSHWLARVATHIERGARMLAAVGREEFLEHSRALYGVPKDTLQDESTTTLAFAREFDAVLESLCQVDLGGPPDACHLASAIAESMERAVRERFGDSAPKVVVVDELSANALAGPQTIRIRRNACFTDRDVHQLIEHEAFVHVLTSLNGRAQPEAPLLALSHPGTTRTQEGLAVFAEFITGSMEIGRLRRLVDRVQAVQMALDGADFLQVYRYFQERGAGEGQAFENARRVFRGGRVEGGVPFTKDIVYLDGLFRVHNFMRTVVSLGRADLLRLLFAGKLDIEDIPALAQLSAAGMCRPPVYLPPWAADLRFLLSYLAYSSFVNSVDLSMLREHYEHMVQAAPLCFDR